MHNLITPRKLLKRLAVLAVGTFFAGNLPGQAQGGPVIQTQARNGVRPTNRWGCNGPSDNEPSLDEVT